MVPYFSSHDRLGLTHRTEVLHPIGMAVYLGHCTGRQNGFLGLSLEMASVPSVGLLGGDGATEGFYWHLISIYQYPKIN